jgi:CRISPR/Cas system-associated exonuclease Cas4 (RecB family)
MDHFFQLLMYGLMYAQKHGPENIRPAIFYVRHSEMEKELRVELDKQPPLTDQPLVDFACDRITEVITDLLDPESAFEQTDDEKRCAFCDFNGICQR